QAALGWYDACLSLVPLSNTAVRRDALEARSRCLSHVGRTDEALQTAHTLGTIATNMDHDCVVHTLVAAIQRQAGHLQGELSALTRLTSLRPLDAWHWRRLAAIYQELSRCARSSVQCNGEQSHSDSDGHSNGGSSCGSGSSRNCDTHRPSDNSDPSTACGFQSCIHSDSHDASTCALPNVGDEECLLIIAEWYVIIRYRLLLQLSSASQSAFILDRNLEAQANITSDLEKSGVGETTLMCMAEVLGEDLVTLGTTGDESQGTDEARSHDDTPNSIGQFEKRWFGRLYGVAHG
uniref:ZHX1-C8orf76 readthrough n=1 Tax=Petromyzon marinus TaxID=7757 RepID=S4RYP3_PETMA